MVTDWKADAVELAATLRFVRSYLGDSAHLATLRIDQALAHHDALLAAPKWPRYSHRCTKCGESFDSPSPAIKPSWRLCQKCRRGTPV